VRTRPTVTAFTASPIYLGEVLPGSPSVWYNTGGLLTLSAQVTNASACAFSSTPTFAGMPSGVLCSNGTVYAQFRLPPNSGARSIKYKLRLIAVGERAARPVAITVKVSPIAPPGPPSVDLQAGAEWTMNVPALFCTVQAFGQNGTWTDDLGQVAFPGETDDSGTYSGNSASISELATTGNAAPFSLTGTWNNGTMRYEGTLTAQPNTPNPVSFPITLSPGATTGC
jgi:hypothetical protein